MNKKNQLIIMGLLLGLVTVSFAQLRYNHLIPTEEAVTTIRVYEKEGRYIIPYLYIDQQSNCTHSRYLLTDFQSRSEYIMDSLAITATPMIQWGERYYGFVRQQNPYAYNTTKAVLMSENLDAVLWEKEWTCDGDVSHNLRNLQHGDKMYLLNYNKYDSTGTTELEITCMDSAGEIHWQKKYYEGANYSYPWDFISVSENELAVSVIHNPDRLSNVDIEVLKIDTLGKVTRTMELKDPPEDGAVKIMLAALSDGSIVVENKTKKYTAEYNALGYDKRPVLLTWFDQKGEKIREKLIKTPAFNYVYYEDVENGKGDYFFAYGQLNQADKEKKYGVLTKFSNEGDTLWTKRYQHPDFQEPGDFHQIRDIIEQDNGDIVCFGHIRRGGEVNSPWLFRVGADGCFSSENCEGEVQLSEVDDYAFPIQPSKLVYYPNPARDYIYVDNYVELSQLVAIDMAGHEIVIPVSGAQVKLDLVPGVYILHAHLKKGGYQSAKLVIE